MTQQTTPSHWCFLRWRWRTVTVKNAEKIITLPRIIWMIDASRMRSPMFTKTQAIKSRIVGTHTISNLDDSERGIWWLSVWLSAVEERFDWRDDSLPCLHRMMEEIQKIGVQRNIPKNIKNTWNTGLLKGPQTPYRPGAWIENMIFERIIDHDPQNTIASDGKTACGEWRVEAMRR